MKVIITKLWLLFLCSCIATKWRCFYQLTFCRKAVFLFWFYAYLSFYCCLIILILSVSVTNRTTISLLFLWYRVFVFLIILLSLYFFRLVHLQFYSSCLIQEWGRPLHNMSVSECFFLISVLMSLGSHHTSCCGFPPLSILYLYPRRLSSAQPQTSFFERFSWLIVSLFECLFVWSTFSSPATFSCSVFCRTYRKQVVSV